ncbi:MAG: hypothetical protein KGP29_01995 [Proteobacteria bacterium]|nr:hypothetical protein [Pseudomonadota bacterium]
MKSDQIINALINFLVPVIFLYGFFFLAGFFSEGFFALIYSATLFLSGFVVLSVKSSERKTIPISWLEFLSFFIVLLLISYLTSVLMLITNLFSI